jgi:hypothetical protein
MGTTEDSCAIDSPPDPVFIEDIQLPLCSVYAPKRESITLTYNISPNYSFGSKPITAIGDRWCAEQGFTAVLRVQEFPYSTEPVERERKSGTSHSSWSVQKCDSNGTDPFLVQISKEEVINIIEQKKYRYNLIDGVYELEGNMPDSVRIKEIHTALDAKYWGSGQEKQFTYKGVNNTLIPDSFESFNIQQSILQGNTVSLESFTSFVIKTTQTMAALIGLGDYPFYRVPTYQPFLEDEFGSEARNSKAIEISSLNALFLELDKELAQKIGLFPTKLSNFAQFDDTGLARKKTYKSLVDIAADTFHLTTRTSLVSEQTRISSLVSQSNSLQIIKGLGISYEMEEKTIPEGKIYVPVIENSL